MQRSTTRMAHTHVLVGCSHESSSKAADDDKTGGVPSGYVEDLVEARTQLPERVSIRLRLLERLKHRHLHIEDAPAFTAAQPHLVADHI